MEDFTLVLAEVVRLWLGGVRIVYTLSWVGRLGMYGLTLF